MPIKRFVYFLFTFLLSVSTIFAQPSAKVKRLIKKNHLAFNLPAGYVNAPLSQHAALPSNYSITKPLCDFEIRYFISPLKSELKAYKKNIKNPTVKLTHPNYLWKVGIHSRILQLSNKEENTPTLREFSEEAFDESFLGDGGGVCYYEISSSANVGYKYAIDMVIHKNFIADVYITFLGNDKDKLQEYSLEAFRAMRFIK